ncbi:MAG: hypothetical protein PVF58_10890 [Candidatus Methanofastidiosia archaeon]|jgi:hypothetical protein
MNTSELFDITFQILKGTIIIFCILVLFKVLSPVITPAHMVSILIIVFSGYIIFSYRKEISSFKNLKPVQPSERNGNIQTLATAIKRASKEYNVSREQVDTILSSFTDEEITIEGKGEQYLKNIKEVIP